MLTVFCNVLNFPLGNVTRSLGSKHFILPHGVFVDHHGNLFVTDVGLHQVLKFEVNQTEPSLVLG